MQCFLLHVFTNVVGRILRPTSKSVIERCCEHGQRMRLRPFHACVRHRQCLTDLNDLLGVQPEVKVTEDEIRQSLEPLIRDPAERLRHGQSQTWSVQQPHLVDKCA